MPSSRDSFRRNRVAPVVKSYFSTDSVACIEAVFHSVQNEGGFVPPSRQNSLRPVVGLRWSRQDFRNRRPEVAPIPINIIGRPTPHPHHFYKNINLNGLRVSIVQ